MLSFFVKVLRLRLRLRKTTIKNTFSCVLTMPLIWQYCTSFLHAIFCTVYSIVFLCLFVVFFGLFRNRSVCFGSFETGPKHRNEPTQTENNCYWFRETNRKWTETDWVSVCFGSNRKRNLFVSRTPYTFWIVSRKEQTYFFRRCVYNFRTSNFSSAICAYNTAVLHTHSVFVI
jgi:hypothetical protein